MASNQWPVKRVPIHQQSLFWKLETPKTDDFFYFLTKKTHIFVAFRDYNFFTIQTILKIYERISSLPKGIKI
ncbi:hypothetical protein C6503_09715 [Candidatus Poribacteria bacterium]|nr:MAG: hypothetical protein C6503_09715 [Candidatus Poribacteria bacterium]